MLVSLHVRNLALIEETEVFFQPGLNILTGETGAGKSVILGSVALALGAKADRDMIRTGAEYALIELTFEGSEEVREALRRMDLPAEDNQIILQRRVMPNRSICRINGETVPIRQMRELAGLLIDIHGQHDSQILLQTKRHLEILDAYAEKELPHVKEAYAACWREHSVILQEIAENELDEQTRKREISLAEFERDEIEEANLQAGEDEQLERDYRRMVNGRKIAETLNLVHGLTGEEEGNGAGELTGRALRELSQVLSCDDGLGQLVQLLADVDGLLNDFNRAVAQHFYWLEEPFLYRVHDNPDPEKMQQLSVFLGNFGYRLHIGRKQGKRQENGADVHPKQLQKLLDQIEGTPEEAMLSRLILRSMKRAVYSPDCSGHFGLAATHYCHFTSPIRRYPDLQIHRIIKEFLRGRLNEKRKEHYEDILNGVAKHSSETERRADEAERICEKMKKAQYMEKHIGETMEAVISGVTGWGFYAELPNTVEGLVPVSSLRSDYFIFDEENSALVGEHTGKTYQLGETVTVRVTGANRYAGTVDFELEEAEKRGNDGKISTETGREQ